MCAISSPRHRDPGDRPFIVTPQSHRHAAKKGQSIFARRVAASTSIRIDAAKSFNPAARGSRSSSAKQVPFAIGSGQLYWRGRFWHSAGKPTWRRVKRILRVVLFSSQRWTASWLQERLLSGRTNPSCCRATLGRVVVRQDKRSDLCANLSTTSRNLVSSGDAARDRSNQLPPTVNR